MADRTPSANQLRELIATSPMSAQQIVAILVCVGLNMLDGFDVLVMSFTASGVSAQWSLSGAELGLLLSAGLVGMAAGSLFLAPAADRFGRRSIVMTSVLIVTLGMLLSGFAQSPVQLGLLRAVTGIGIGGILASATVLVAESSSATWRNTASYLYTSGYSLGATLGGTVAGLLIARYGWRAAFLFGALMSIVMLPIAYWGLPESMDFLLTRRPAGALEKLNRLLTRMNQATVDGLPGAQVPRVPLEEDRALSADSSPPRATSRFYQLFAPGLLRSTLLNSLAFFFMMGGYYFVFSWTPKLLAANGLTAQQGITSGVLLSLGGIVGTVLFAFIAKAIDVRKLIAFCLIVASALMSVFAMTSHALNIGLLTGVALGAMTTSAMAGFYALTPALYAADLRTTGMGFGIGIGRFGAILAPTLTGLLVDRGWHALQLYLLFAGTFLVAALALAMMVPSPARIRMAEELQ
jgi:benzoate transport